MKMLALPEETVNAIVGYLGTRPYAEVVNLLNSITGQAIIVNVQKAEEIKTDKKDKKEPKLVKKDEAPAPEKKGWKMSEQDNKKKKRWVGKVRNLNHSNGSYQKILMDNINTNNKDGSPNTYYKGSLIWFDQETGKRFLVKQLGFGIPKDGMNAGLVQKGYIQFVTIDLEDKFDVEELP